MFNSNTAKKIIIFIICFMAYILILRLQVYFSIKLYDSKNHFAVLSLIQGLSLIPFIFVASLLGFRISMIFTVLLIAVNYQRIIMVFSKDSLSFYMVLSLFAILTEHIFIAFIIKSMNNKFSFNVKSAVVSGFIISPFMYFLNYLIVPAIYGKYVLGPLVLVFTKEYLSNYLMLGVLYTTFDCVFVSIVNDKIIKKFILKNN